MASTTEEVLHMEIVSRQNPNGRAGLTRCRSVAVGEGGLRASGYLGLLVWCGRSPRDESIVAHSLLVGYGFTAGHWSPLGCSSPLTTRRALLQGARRDSRIRGRWMRKSAPEKAGKIRRCGYTNRGKQLGGENGCNEHMLFVQSSPEFLS